jgi:uncharacterized membrane protein YfcA
MAQRRVDIQPAADEPAHAVDAPSAAPPGPEPRRPAWRRLLDPQLIAIGLAGGLLSGLLGVGGGVIMVPLLVLWAGYAQRDAHALSLGAIIPISLAGIATYGIAGEVRIWDALALSIGAVAGARVGAGLLARLDEHVLKLAFGVFLLCVAVFMGVRA